MQTAKADLKTMAKERDSLAQQVAALEKREMEMKDRTNFLETELAELLKKQEEEDPLRSVLAKAKSASQRRLEPIVKALSPNPDPSGDLETEKKRQSTLLGEKLKEMDMSFDLDEIESGKETQERLVRESLAKKDSTHDKETADIVTSKGSTRPEAERNG